MRGSCLAVLIAALFLMSCCAGTDPGDNVPHDQDSVLGTLYLFEDVWNNGDLDTYEKLLDEESFTFYYDPWDVEDHDLPISWGYEEEIEVYTNIFDAVGDENVDVQLDLDGVAEPEGDVETYSVQNVPYEIDVYVEEEGVTYTGRGYFNMQLDKTGGQWVITIWWEVGGYRLPGVEDTSWGAIKVMYGGGSDE